MELDYSEIGRRIARRRKQLNLKQSQLSELIDISNPYMSNIEHAVSIPSIEVIMKLAIALDTTPDEFLVGTSRWPGEEWKAVAEQLRPLNKRQLNLVLHFIAWMVEEGL